MYYIRCYYLMHEQLFDYQKEEKGLKNVFEVNSKTYCIIMWIIVKLIQTSICLYNISISIGASSQTSELNA